MISYEETTARGAAQYKDILVHLDVVDLLAVFSQTGGMCAAIQIQLETGRELLIPMPRTLCPGPGPSDAGGESDWKHSMSTPMARSV